MAPDAEQALAELAVEARRADGRAEWPAESFRLLGRAGGWRWAIPREFGGDGLDGPALMERYESLASACLTTAFLLSQRDAAVRRIREHAPEEMRRDMLPALATGERFATVGLSQLTTSRQHTGPALRIEEDGEFDRLDGVMPWVTGACRADYLVAGAVLPDHQQVLLVVPGGTPGLVVDPPLELMALQGSMTGEVRCDGVRLPRALRIAGPSAAVLKSARGGTGGLETSCLGLGLAAAALHFLEDEASRRPDLGPTVEKLAHGVQTQRRHLHELADGGATPELAVQLRARVNSLVLRITQAALAAAKGAGFQLRHPAQRWARQALFFLVWSCPRPAVEAALAELSAFSECEL